MESKIFLVIGVLLVSLIVCVAYFFYNIGFTRGFKKCKEIDDEILESKGIMVSE